ncbi:hypothetical protein TGRUB_277540, partial [Toxoplasma gondii RUB]
MQRMTAFALIVLDEEETEESSANSELCRFGGISVESGDDREEHPRAERERADPSDFQVSPFSCRASSSSRVPSASALRSSAPPSVDSASLLTKKRVQEGGEDRGETGEGRTGGGRGREEEAREAGGGRSEDAAVTGEKRERGQSLQGLRREAEQREREAEQGGQTGGQRTIRGARSEGHNGAARTTGTMEIRDDDRSADKSAKAGDQRKREQAFRREAESLGDERINRKRKKESTRLGPARGDTQVAKSGLEDDAGRIPVVRSLEASPRQTKTKETSEIEKAPDDALGKAAGRAQAEPAEKSGSETKENALTVQNEREFDEANGAKRKRKRTQEKEGASGGTRTAGESPRQGRAADGDVPEEPEQRRRQKRGKANSDKTTRLKKPQLQRSTEKERTHRRDQRRPALRERDDASRDENAFPLDETPETRANGDFDRGDAESGGGFRTKETQGEENERDEGGRGKKTVNRRGRERGERETESREESEVVLDTESRDSQRQPGMHQENGGENDDAVEREGETPACTVEGRTCGIEWHVYSFDPNQEGDPAVRATILPPSTASRRRRGSNAKRQDSSLSAGPPSSSSSSSRCRGSKKQNVEADANRIPAKAALSASRFLQAISFLPQDPMEAAALARRARERLLTIAQTQEALRREQRRLLAFLWRMQQRPLSLSETQRSHERARASLDEKDDSREAAQRHAGDPQGGQEASDREAETPRETGRDAEVTTEFAAETPGEEGGLDALLSSLSSWVLYPDEQQLLRLQMDRISCLFSTTSPRGPPAPDKSPSHNPTLSTFSSSSSSSCPSSCSSSSLSASSTLSSSSATSSSASSSFSSSSSSSPECVVATGLSSSLSSAPSASVAHAPSSAGATASVAPASAPLSSASSAFSSASLSVHLQSASASPARAPQSPLPPDLRPSLWALATGRAASRRLGLAPPARATSHAAGRSARAREEASRASAESQTDDARSDCEEASTDEDTPTLEDEDQASDLASDSEDFASCKEKAKCDRRENATGEEGGNAKTAKAREGTLRGSNHMAGLLRSCMQMRSARDEQEEFLLVGGECHALAGPVISALKEESGENAWGEMAKKLHAHQTQDTECATRGPACKSSLSFSSSSSSPFSSAAPCSSSAASSPRLCYSSSPASSPTSASSSSASSSSSPSPSSSALSSSSSSSSLVLEAAGLVEGLEDDCVSSWLSRIPSQVEAFFPSPLRQLQFARRQSLSSIARASEELRKQGEEAWRRGESAEGLGFFFFHLFLEKVQARARDGAACTCAFCEPTPNSQWTDSSSQATAEAAEKRETKMEERAAPEEEAGSLAEGETGTGRLRNGRGDLGAEPEKGEEKKRTEIIGGQGRAMTHRHTTEASGDHSGGGPAGKGETKNSYERLEEEAMAGRGKQRRREIEKLGAGRLCQSHSPEQGQLPQDVANDTSEQDRTSEKYSRSSSSSSVPVTSYSSVSPSSTSSSSYSSSSSSFSLPSWLTLSTGSLPPREEAPGSDLRLHAEPNEVQNLHPKTPPASLVSAASPAAPEETLSASLLSASAWASSLPSCAPRWSPREAAGAGEVGARTVSSSPKSSVSVSASSFLSVEEEAAEDEVSRASHLPEGRNRHPRAQGETSTGGAPACEAACDGDRRDTVRDAPDATTGVSEDGDVCAEEVEAAAETKASDREGEAREEFEDSSEVEELTCVIIGERRKGASEACSHARDAAHADKQAIQMHRAGTNEGDARKEEAKNTKKDGTRYRKVVSPPDESRERSVSALSQTRPTAEVGKTFTQEERTQEARTDVIYVEGSDSSSSPRTASQVSLKQCLGSQGPEEENDLCPQTDAGVSVRCGDEQGQLTEATARCDSQEAKANENAFQWADRTVVSEANVCQKTSIPQPHHASPSGCAEDLSLRPLSTPHASPGLKSSLRGISEDLKGLAALPLLDRLKARLQGGASLSVNQQVTESRETSRSDSSFQDANEDKSDGVPLSPTAGYQFQPRACLSTFHGSSLSDSTSVTCSSSLSSSSSLPCSSSVRSAAFSSVLCEIDWSSADARLLSEFRRHFGLKKSLPEPLLRRMLHRICIYLVTHDLYPLAALPPFDFLHPKPSSNEQVSQTAAACSAEEAPAGDAETATATLSQRPAPIWKAAPASSSFASSFAPSFAPSASSPSPPFSPQHTTVRNEVGGVCLHGDRGADTDDCGDERRSRPAGAHDNAKREAERGRRKSPPGRLAQLETGDSGDNSRGRRDEETETAKTGGEKNPERAPATNSQKASKRGATAGRRREAREGEAEEGKSKKKRKTAEKREVELSAEAIQAAIVDHDQLYEKFLTHQSVALRDVYLYLR